MAKEIDFTEKQQVIGYVETHSGSIALLDGIIESELKMSPDTFVAVDVNLDRKRIPVIATRQGGRRYLLLALDAAEDIPPVGDETVETEGKVKMDKEKDNDANKK